MIAALARVLSKPLVSDLRHIVETWFVWALSRHVEAHGRSKPGLTSHHGGRPIADFGRELGSPIAALPKRPIMQAAAFWAARGLHCGTNPSTVYLLPIGYAVPSSCEFAAEDACR